MDTSSTGDQLCMSILSGDLEAARKVRKKSLRVFISSTFKDTHAERNYLMREVYPKIRLFCAEKGLQFSIVDFRWGIRDHATINHKSTEICLNEIDRCFQESIAGPSFVILSFNRYGWTPLPRIVKATEFEAILSMLSKEEDKVFVLKFYKKDENAVPPEYVLQPICKHMDEFESVKETWYQHNDRLKDILQENGLLCEQLSEEQKVKWRISVTENEVQQAIHQLGDISQRAFAMVRNISGLPKLEINNEPAKDFYDQSQSPIERLRSVLDTSKIEKKVFEVEWKSKVISEDTHTDYIKEFGQEFENTMKKMIIKAISQVPTCDNLSSEVATHSVFCSKRGEAFYGRSTLVEEGMRYFKEVRNKRSPFIIHGISGAGKTSFLSKLALEAKTYVATKSKSSPVLVIRFCGTTPDSSNAMSLMNSICKQVSVAYNGEIPTSVENFGEQIKAFKECLTLATSSRPLLLFIDSLDQLTDDDQGRSNLRWVKENLPDNVYFVLSTLPDIGGCCQYLKRKAIPEQNYLEIKLLTNDDSSTILRSWLNLAHRTLTDQQYNYVLTLAKDQSNEKPTSLRLRLLYDLAVKCASYDVLVDIPNTICQLIGRFLQELEKEHGKIFVSTLFGLLGTSKFGLSENDLLDILSCQEDVLTEVLKYHQPPVRRIPQVVFARLRNDLGEFVVDRGAYNKPVLAWYHRQFWQTADARYLSNGCGKYAEMIRAYFTSELHEQYTERKILAQPYFWKCQSSNLVLFNLHKLVQLPYAVLLLKRTEHLEHVLCDFQFIAASLETGLGRELIRTLRYALDDCESEKLKQVRQFLSSRIHLLDRHPSSLLQEALNFEDGSFVHEEAAKYVGTPDLVTPWNPIPRHKVCREVNKSTSVQSCIMTLTENTEKVKHLCLWGEDYMFSNCENKHVILWSLETGQIEKTIDFPDEVDDIAQISSSCNKNSSHTGVSDTMTIELAFACLNGKIYFYRFTSRSDKVKIHLNYALDAHSPPYNRIRLVFGKERKKYLVSGACYFSISSIMGEVHVWDMSECCVLSTELPKSVQVRTLRDMEKKLSKSDTVCCNKDKEHEKVSFGRGFRAVSFLKDESCLLVAQESQIIMCSVVDLVAKCIFPMSLENICAVEVRELGSKASLVVSNGSCLKFYRIIIGQEKMKLLPGRVYGNESASLHVATNSVVCHTKGDKVEVFENTSLASYLKPQLEFLTDNHGRWGIVSRSLRERKYLKFLGLLVGHSCSINTCCIDDNLVVTASIDGIIKVWNLKNLEPKCFTELHLGAIRSCHFQKEKSLKRKTVTMESDGTTKVWNSETGEMFKNEAAKVTFSKQESMYFCFRGCTDQVHVNTTGMYKTFTSILPMFSLDQIHYSNDREMVLVVEMNSATIVILHLYRRQVYEIPLKSLPIKITEAAGALFFPDTSKVLAWGSCKHFKEGVKTAGFVIDLEAGKLVENKHYSDKELQEMGLVLKPVTSTSRASTHVPDYLRVEVTHQLEEPMRILCADFVNGASVAVFGTETGYIQIRRLENFELLVEAKAHGGSVLGISCTKDGRYLATGSNDGWVKVWRSSDLSIVGSVFNGADVTSVLIFKGSSGNLFINFGDSKGEFGVFEVLDSNFD